MPRKSFHSKTSRPVTGEQPTDTEPTTRLSEQVYESIVELIVRGELPPGKPISELELSRQLQVSRTPVHEAVTQLVKDGLIEQPPNRRPVVVSFGLDDISDVYLMRGILESEAAALAAQRMDLPTIDRLQQSLQGFKIGKAAEVTIANWVKLDDDFHHVIASASGSPRLRIDIDRYRLLHRIFNRSHTDPSVLRQAIDEHAKIIAAIKRRDSDAAREAMRSHLAEWQRFFISHFRDLA